MYLGYLKGQGLEAIVLKGKGANSTEMPEKEEAGQLSLRTGVRGAVTAT